MIRAPTTRRRRVAGEDLLVSRVGSLLCQRLTQPNSLRYRLQAAAAQGMAAYSHPQDRPPYTLPHRRTLWPNWRSPDLGLFSGFRN